MPYKMFMRQFFKQHMIIETLEEKCFNLIALVKQTNMKLMFHTDLQNYLNGFNTTLDPIKTGSLQSYTTPKLYIKATLCTYIRRDLNGKL